jgi:endonuclease/exonuclease/phosphatase (EEP) superfamily protein YafD
LGLAALLILGPVMGLRTGWRSLLPGGEVNPPLTVVTLNAQVGNHLYTSLANLLSEWDAEVAAFQECGGELERQLRRLPGWYTDARSGLCLASRFEILEVLEMDREALQFAGGAGIVVTYRLALDPGPVYLTNLHLETPREGFELIRAGRLRSGIEAVRQKSLLRGVELRRARLWTDRFEGPHIVVGDFNTPVESRAYQTSWGDWTNAFSTAGWGFGGTRLNGWIRVRIDHVLANDEWHAQDAWVEGDVGSDHLPLAARLSLR